MARQPYFVRQPKLDQAVAAASIGRTMARPYYMDARQPKIDPYGQAREEDMLTGPKMQYGTPIPPPPPPRDARYWFSRYSGPRQLGATANRPRPMLTLQDLFRGLFG